MINTQQESSSSSLSPETTEGEHMSKKSAVCVGINDYPGTANDLSGCVNDYSDWATVLKNVYKFDSITTLANSKATIGNVVSALTKLINGAKSGDCIVFTYSGHGTSVPDTNGDEPDGRDEAICLYDGNLIDDKIREIISKVKDGVKFTIISDSCHSGSVTRLQLKKGKAGKKGYKKARYMPPKDIKEAMLISRLPLKGKVFTTEDMKEILIAGCQSSEYSYDAYINNRYNGAMTYHAINVIKQNPTATYEEFYTELRKRLPSDEYQQSPQLEGRVSNLKTKLFVF